MIDLGDFDARGRRLGHPLQNQHGSRPGSFVEKRAKGLEAGLHNVCISHTLTLTTSLSNSVCVYIQQTDQVLRLSNGDEASRGRPLSICAEEELFDQSLSSVLMLCSATASFRERGEVLPNPEEEDSSAASLVLNLCTLQAWESHASSCQRCSANLTCTLARATQYSLRQVGSERDGKWRQSSLSILQSK